MAASSGVWTLPLTGPVSLSTVFAAPCAPPCSSVGSLTHREACGHRGAACERLWYTACLAVLSSAVNFTGPPSSWLQSHESMSRRWLWNPEKQDPSPHLGSGFAHPPRRPLLLQGPWLSMHGQTCTRPRECGPAGCHQNHRPSPEGGGSPDLLARGFLGFSFSFGRVRASGAVAGAGLAMPPPASRPTAVSRRVLGTGALRGGPRAGAGLRPGSPTSRPGVCPPCAPRPAVRLWSVFSPFPASCYRLFSQRRSPRRRGKEAAGFAGPGCQGC